MLGLCDPPLLNLGLDKALLFPRKEGCYMVGEPRRGDVGYPSVRQPACKAQRSPHPCGILPQRQTEALEVVSPVVKPRMTPPGSMECQVQGCLSAGGGLYRTLNHMSAKSQLEEMTLHVRGAHTWVLTGAPDTPKTYLPPKRCEFQDCTFSTEGDAFVNQRETGRAATPHYHASQ